MIYTILILTIILLVYIGKSYIEYQQHSHERELDHVNEFADLRVNASIWKTTAELAQSYGLQREKDHDSMLNFLQKVVSTGSSHRQAQPLPYSHDLQLPEKTAQNTVYTVENTPEEVGEGRKVVDFLPCTFDREQEGITKMTQSGGVVFIYKGSQKDSAKIPDGDKPSYFAIFKYYMQFCEECDGLYLAKSEKSKFCCESHKNDHHNRKK